MRSRSMQALTDDIAAAYPGVTIYGIGDAAHQLRASDHNEDDTSGSRPAQSDADSNPEHRAIDVMLGPAMSRAQLQGLVERVVAAEQARERAGGEPRLRYVIFDGWLYSRTYGWVKQPKLDDPHPDHAHFSGLASGDENAASWPAVTAHTNGDDDMDQDRANNIIATDARQRAVMFNLPYAEFHIPGEPAPRKERNEVHFALKALAEKPAVVVDQAVLEAALRKVLGAVDGATPDN